MEKKVDNKSKVGNIPIATLKEIVDNTVKQNPKVFERLAEI
ncbi:hypothetical protein NVIE_013160 [Nitrososphaera viennensis EN76]|uniref:Uncharacterized protein n=1 Tax=Nitrososphaera viennensis EN76 TaxID=926571 RepID=A0A060HPS1_9ARCH|nr:hypothetical protein NVIE_013160 [Nitrososphaera viennensis EN76]